MTLFTKRECTLCDQLKQKFDLGAMQVEVEILDNDNAESLAHLAWHGLVDTARKSLPILVLDDSSNIEDFTHIEKQLKNRAQEYGIAPNSLSRHKVNCDSNGCRMQ
ncbi:hypothetical protein ACFL6N_05150 [Thermodesulfobacteriota bacterium]